MAATVMLVFAIDTWPCLGNCARAIQSQQCIVAMKLLALLCLLSQQLVQEGACTHLETCECDDEIRKIVNTIVKESAADLETRYD